MGRTEDAPGAARGSEAARRFLEELQGSIYESGALGRRVNMDWSPEAREALEQDLYERSQGIFSQLAELSGGAVTRESMRQNRDFLHDKVFEATPTRYEFPATYQIVSGLAQEIEHAIELIPRSSTARPPHPLIGTLPTGRVNAMAIRVPGTKEHIIAFEMQLFNFCLLFTKAITFAMPFKRVQGGRVELSTQLSEITERISKDTEVGDRFFQLVSSYVMDGAPGRAPSYSLRGPWVMLASHYLHVMEFFIMAHEYAHVYLRHSGRRKAAASLLGGDPAQILEWNHKQEIDADCAAVLWLMHSRDIDLNPMARFVGVSLFFGALSVIDRALTLLLFGAERALTSRTHPTHSARQKNAYKMAVGVCVLLGQGDLSAEIKKESDVIYEIIEALWQQVRPQFLRMHERGVKPHAMWTAKI